MDEEEDKKKEKLIIKKFKKKKIRIAIHMRRSNIFFNIISRKGNTLQQFSCANFDIHNSKKRKNIIRYDIAYAFGMKLKEAGIKKVKPSFTNRSRGYRRILKAFKRTKLKFSAKHFRIKKYKPHNGCPKKMRKRKHRSIKKRKLRFKTRKLRKKKRRRLKKFRLALGEEIKKDKKNNVILGNYLNYLNLLRNARSITAAKKKRYYIMAIRKKAGLFSIHKLKRIARKKKKLRFIFFRQKILHFYSLFKKKKKKKWIENTKRKRKNKIYYVNSKEFASTQQFFKENHQTNYKFLKILKKKKHHQWFLKTYQIIKRYELTKYFLENQEKKRLIREKYFRDLKNKKILPVVKPYRKKKSRFFYNSINFNNPWWNV